MSVLINFKICDNSKDCSGIEVCPVNALYWDEQQEKIGIDNEKCISCGKCEEACPVGAIRVAETKEEYEKIRKEIEQDPRRVADLFVDRYGGEPISTAFLIDQDKFPIQILEATQLAVVEFFCPESIHCLLHSIPIKTILGGLGKCKYRKIEVGEDNPLLEEYGIEELPCLAFFKDGELIGKIEGYYGEGRKNELKQNIDKIVS